jgi:hypothetical protein
MGLSATNACWGMKRPMPRPSHPTRDNAKEFLYLIEENERLHMTKRPKMAKTPYEVTAETAREVEKVTQLVCDVGDMLAHLPRPELVTAALMKLQAAVEGVVRGQVTK